MKHYLNMLIKKYVDFEGRASRREYWTIFLCHFTILLIFNGLIFVFISYFKKLGATLFILFLVYYIFTFIPILALGVRRLHDTGKEGAFILVKFIPYIGIIWFLVLVALKGNSGPNVFGAEPTEY